jgi:hypothetical protein
VNIAIGPDPFDPQAILHADAISARPAVDISHFIRLSARVVRLIGPPGLTVPRRHRRDACSTPGRSLL